MWENEQTNPEGKQKYRHFKVPPLDSFWCQTNYELNLQIKLVLDSYMLWKKGIQG